MFKKKRTSLAITALLGLSALLAAPGQVFGQDEQIAEDDEMLEEVIITGSRIRRDDYTSSTPLSVVTGQEILDSGMVNLGEALRMNTAMGTGGFNQSSVLSGGGSTSIDLRNLGQARVLILINGRRVASFADALANQAADLTFVPTAMVERVEILRDGAAAVYGSDAITGVVNIILKTDYEGAELSINAGQAQEGDGTTLGTSITMGTTSDRGNVMLGLEYRENDPIFQVDRDWAFPAISSLTSTSFQNGSFFSPGGTFLGNGGAVFCTRSKALGGDEVTDVSGTIGCESLAPRQTGTHPDDAELVRYDYALQQSLLIESDTFSASGYGNYQLSDNVNVFSEFQFAKRESISYLDGNPGSFGTPSFPAGSFVPATNPNNPTGQDGFFYFRPTSTIGPRTQNIESNTVRAVAGINGDIPFLEDWQYEASFLYTRVDADLNTNSVWNLARFIRISDPDLCSVDSQCSQIVNPSGALDTFRPGNWTEDEIQYLRQRSLAVSKFQTHGWQAIVNGPLFEGWAGEWAMAAGVESRKEYGFNKPDSFTEGGESVANQVFTTEGRYSVDELFAEVDIPLLNDVFLVDDLTLNLQYRYFDYDSFGSDDVYRVGLNWSVTPWLRLRGNVSTAFRAPQVTDLFGGGTVSFDFFTDPCEGAAPGSNAYQNCVLSGIDPDTFVQITAQYPVLAGSNPDLSPETADTYTAGFVLTPGGFLEGLQVTFDVWDIEVQDLIGRPSSDSVLDDCYNGPVGLTAPECSQFDGRQPGTGVPTNFVNRLTNLSNVETNGYDFAINYATEFGTTYWNFILQGTYVDENTFYPFAGGADNRGSIPDLQALFRVDVGWQDWNFAWGIRYIASMDDPRYDGNNPFSYSGPGSYDIHDIRATWNLGRWRLMAGVNNLFDKDPPYIFGSGNNTDTFLYDVIGRYYFARATVNFGQ